MFGWFPSKSSKPECPVDPQTKEWIERRMTWLTEQFGWARLRSATSKGLSFWPRRAIPCFNQSDVPESTS